MPDLDQFKLAETGFLSALMDFRMVFRRPSASFTSKAALKQSAIDEYSTMAIVPEMPKQCPSAGRPWTTRLRVVRRAGASSRKPRQSH
jgi:hypothetical protein